MLLFEKMGKMTMQFLSGSFITDTIKKVRLFRCFFIVIVHGGSK